MDQSNQDTVASRPSGASENEGIGETPAGGTANPPEALEHEFTASEPAPAPAPASAPAAAAAPETALAPAPVSAPSAEPTVANRLQGHVAALDVQISDLADRQAAIASAPGNPQIVAAQAKALDGSINILREEKNRILALIEELPEELHALEARFIGAIKHLF